MSPVINEMALAEKQELMRGSKGLPKRIYMLGVGNIGTFIAHSLAGIPNRPPMTLLLRRPERLRDFRAQGSVLKLTTHNMTETRSGFEIEALDWGEQSKSDLTPTMGDGGSENGNSSVSRDEYSSLQAQDASLYASDKGLETSIPMARAPPPSVSDGLASNQDDMDITPQEANEQSVPSDDAGDQNVARFNVDIHGNADHESQEARDHLIYHLIVAVKGPHTVNAIRPYLHRLTPQSTILFVQNGMGMVDEVNKELFPSEADRPHYMVGVLSHGLYGKNPFDIVHAGEGTLALGLLSAKNNVQYPPSARYLLRTMTRTPVFVAVGMQPIELLQQQLDKLAVNAVINPLTALFDCLNSSLLDNFFVTRVMRLLLAEISVVFRSLPELENVVNVNMRFDTARLESMVVGVAKLTGANQSSMLQDVRAGRETEIDYISGYIVKRGEEQGIHCVTNYAIMQMVKAKGQMNQRNLESSVPLHPSIRRRR